LLPKDLLSDSALNTSAMVLCPLESLVAKRV